MFYGLKPWFEVVGFFVVLAFFAFLCLFCLDRCFPIILMVDSYNFDDALC